jgi:flavin reductase (DIM6/NTAB) family NADH-FMN oxidoreductase RutF
MRLVPSPITVVTARGSGGIRGATIGSFTSLNLTPPLVSFNVTNGSRIHDTLTTADYFAVHLLSGGQDAVAAHFAGSYPTGAEQFEGVPHVFSPHGVPLLDDTAAVLSCATHQILDLGPKSIVIGRVLQAETDPAASVLLYHRRQYTHSSLDGQPVTLPGNRALVAHETVSGDGI